MIRHTVVKPNARKVVFKDSKLAHENCRGEGLEIGAAAHNPFNLPGSRNVAPMDDFEFYKGAQVGMNGEFAEIDIIAEADHMPMIADSSQNYVINSHVFEHLSDPIKALREWHRVVRDGGIVFMIVPHRDALAADKGRKLTTLAELVEAYERGYTVDSHPFQAQGRRGHYHVFDVASVTDLVSYTNSQGWTDWQLMEALDNDDKVGNGFLLVFRVSKPVEVEPDVPADEIKVEWSAGQPVEVVGVDAGAPGDMTAVVIAPEVAPPAKKKAAPRKKKAGV